MEELNNSLDVTESPFTVNLLHARGFLALYPLETPVSVRLPSFLLTLNLNINLLLNVSKCGNKFWLNRRTDNVRIPHGGGTK